MQYLMSHPYLAAIAVCIAVLLIRHGAIVRAKRSVAQVDPFSVIREMAYRASNQDERDELIAAVESFAAPSPHVGTILHIARRETEPVWFAHLVEEAARESQRVRLRAGELREAVSREMLHALKEKRSPVVAYV